DLLITNQLLYQLSYLGTATRLMRMPQAVKHGQRLRGRA
ncbi:MAG: hypothetical protein ACI8PZ_003319, partial [Myxococcota bacterium]